MPEHIGVTAVAMESKIVKFAIELNKIFTTLFIINKHIHIFCIEAFARKSLVDAFYFAVLPITSVVLPIQSAVLIGTSAVLIGTSVVLPIQSTVLPIQSTVLPIQNTVLPSTSAVIPPKKRKNRFKKRVLEFYL